MNNIALISVEVENRRPQPKAKLAEVHQGIFHYSWIILWAWFTATYIPLHVGKGNQQHLQEILFRKERKERQGEMEALREVWEKGKKRKEKGIPDVKSGVQGQAVFM